ncbi:kinase-like domain-containing protein [Xylariaceae sp. FL0255]|nr:kinase-like domain-containing protein [Xylariaceae sp. FL0255]
MPLRSGTLTRVFDYGARAWRLSRPFHQTNDGEKENTGSNGSTSMKELLEQAMQITYPDTKNTFLPLGHLEKICNRQAVEDELKSCLKSQRRARFKQRVQLGLRGEVFSMLKKNPPSMTLKQLVSYVFGDSGDSTNATNTSRKIFAILVLTGQLSRIESFLKEDLRDRHLPLYLVSPGSNASNIGLARRGSHEIDETLPTSCFDSWNKTEKRKFYEEQWRLLSPYFASDDDGSAVLYELAEQTILPFVMGSEKQESPPVMGGFGQGKDTQRNTFAIKELYDNEEAIFKKEFQNLRKLNMKTHLLSVYAAYRLGGTCHSFIFPWAEGGSLKDLLRTEPRSLKKCTPEHPLLILWLAKQLAGITGKEGLGFLHDASSRQTNTLTVLEGARNYGIHGDIKPANILHFFPGISDEDGRLGTLKIADFGITAFHNTITRSNQDLSGPISNTYKAPEYDMRGLKYLSRAYDIWSLGCVMLQLLTWFIEGREAVVKFTQEREEEEENITTFTEDKFYNHQEEVHATPELKNSVRRQIEKLQNIVRPDNYLHDCLSLIQKHMLVIDNYKRWNCHDLHQSLNGFYERCRKEPAYRSVKLSTFETNVESPAIQTQSPIVTVTQHSQ